MELSIQSEDGDVVHVTIAGKITQSQLASVGDPLGDLLGPEVYSRKVLFNLRETETLDSSGVGWLLTTQKKFKGSGGHLVLYSIPPMVLNVFKVLRMTLVFKLAETENEAVNLIQGDE